jgi:hypothetical protein
MCLTSKASRPFDSTRTGFQYHVAVVRARTQQQYASAHHCWDAGIPALRRPFPPLGAMRGACRLPLHECCLYPSTHVLYKRNDTSHNLHNRPHHLSWTNYTQPRILLPC